MIITKKTYLTEVNSFINLYAEKKIFQREETMKSGK